MYPEMRRKKQQLSEEACIEILKKGKTGILGVSTEKHPSLTPLNFVYEDHHIYFHCAKTGFKLEAIEKNPEVTFCVICKDEVKPEEYSTSYESVMAYGNAHPLMNEDEKRKALRMLIHKYCEVDDEQADSEIDKEISVTCVIDIALDHVIGKFHL